MRDMYDVLKVACGYLDERGIDYAIVGGLAVIAMGRFRTTGDAEFIIQMDVDDALDFAAHLRRNGFSIGERDITSAFREKSHATAIEKESLLRLDIKGVYDEMARDTLRTRRPVELKGVKVYVAAPESIIAAKLLYGSEQDLDDAAAVYICQKGELDERYLEKACGRAGVAKELAKLRRRLKREL